MDTIYIGLMDHLQLIAQKILVKLTSRLIIGGLYFSLLLVCNYNIYHGVLHCVVQYNYVEDMQCDTLLTPANGVITSCSSGRVGMGYEQDACRFTCNNGYELFGSDTRTYQSDGSWSGSPVSCMIMECPSSSLPMNSMLAESCSSTYQSVCELQCQEGFNGTGDPSYVCDVLRNGSKVMWIAEGDAWRCERG